MSDYESIEDGIKRWMGLFPNYSRNQAIAALSRERYERGLVMLEDEMRIRADERRRVLDEVTAMVEKQITDWYPAGHVALDAVVRELIDMRGDDDWD